MPDWAEGVPIGPQSSVYHGEAVAEVEKLLKEHNLPITTLARTTGGNTVTKPAENDANRRSVQIKDPDEVRSNSGLSYF